MGVERQKYGAFESLVWGRKEMREEESGGELLFEVWGSTRFNYDSFKSRVFL